MFFSSFIHLTEKGQISKRKMAEVLYFIYKRFVWINISAKNLIYNFIGIAKLLLATLKESTVQ